ncbi:MAG: hypothetical protein LQ347_002859 [Umbilicaria vellea]|nr:MAG: hypothetical protein LQ347_002859 [Umbilicaria vellea]
MEDCRSKLSKLGKSHAGLDEQRLFFLQIGQYFQSLVKAAVDGTYSDTFFGDVLLEDSYSKRLCSLVQNSNVSFAQSMRTQGQKHQIIEGNHNAKLNTIAIREKPDAHIGPKVVGRKEYINKVKKALKRSGGRELLGMYNPMVVADLFLEQSKPWETLARDHIGAYWEATRAFLDYTIAHT